MSEQDGVRVLHFPEGNKARVVVLPQDDLTAWQDLVDGDLEEVRLKDGISLMCNEDGIRLEMEPNRLVPPALTGWFDPWRSTIRGPFFLLNHDETSLTDQQISRILHAFGETLEVSDTVD